MTIELMNVRFMAELRLYVALCRLPRANLGALAKEYYAALDALERECRRFGFDSAACYTFAAERVDE